LNSEECMIIRSRYRDGVAYATTESSTVLSFDHATVQGAVAGGDVEIEFYEGVSDVGTTSATYGLYGGEQYEMKLVNGTFDMSHCEVVRWDTVEFARAGETTPSPTNVESVQTRGPLKIVHTRQASGGTAAESWTAAEALYTTSRGNKMVWSARTGASYTMKVICEVGILK